MAEQKFRVLFCERFNCPCSDFEEKLFRQCLYWHARLLVPLLRSLKKDFFAEDFRFIRYLGEATGVREANANAADFHDANSARPSFWRNQLKIRVSGRKATRLAYELFSRMREPRHHDRTATPDVE